ncbi:DUF1523 family protein [Tropicimonas sp. IMCC34011]|uniref:DUF1523 family protein n=1 Tax=Tropicimonas sp. IMCC34011 TaxID=2248759 RepID=UPI000E21EE64|nr:DUF1523 family protein [Tropicimonas sp. IMCC34011]
MRYLKWTFWIVFWVIFAAFLHYTLPQTDIVRITDTETRRVDFGENSIFWASPDSGNATGTINRDVFFIQAIRTNGKPIVYRNEDTGWGWPPYFKFDTANLQTRSADLRSTSAEPQWAAMRHYGWRNEYLSIYPNATSVRPVSGPDVTIIPWFNIIVLILLAMLVWFIWARWRRFRERRLDPMWDERHREAGSRPSGARRWFDGGRKG